MNNHNLVDDYILYLKVVRKDSELTIKSYEIDINEYYRYLDKKNLKAKNIDNKVVRDYLNYLYNSNINKSSISRKLSAIRSFYNYLLKQGLVDINHFNEVSNPKKDELLPRYIRSDELNKMFEIPDISKPLGQRNLLILELLYATGIRDSELVSIKINDINMSDNTIKIMGKGSKERLVIFGSRCEEILDSYISKTRKVLLKNNNSEYLLLNKDGNKLSDRYVRKLFDDIVFKASLEVEVSPHVLRHTFATDMLNNGADLVSVKELLGHNSLSTTSIYTHVSNEHIKEVYNFAHPRAKEGSNKNG